MNNASLELGGDNWAAKDASLLGYTVSDDSGRFYPREFTFARGSNLSATRVNADGYIEKGYENLLVQSNNFGTTWVNGGTTVTSGQSGYDGTNNAWLLSKGAADYTRITQTIAKSGVHSVSVYAKANTLSQASFYVYATGDNPYAIFNLVDGSVVASGSIIDKSATDVGNGWWRLSITFNATTQSINFYPDFSESNAGSIYIQDAMLNQGLAALPYVESGASAAKAGILENEPRIDYSSGTASLLLEPSRTNLVPYSEYIDGLGLTDLTTTPNATTSPEGVQNAYKMLTGTAGNEQISHQVTGTSGNNKTHSVYIKADSGVQWIRLIQIRSGFSNSASIWFDIQNGVKGSKTGDGATSVVDDATKIEDAGNGWYRLTLVCTDSTNNTNFDTRVRTAIADGSLTRVSNGSYFVWGYQMESDASYPTSYIPNHSGGTITRGADRAQILNTTTDVLSQTAFTLFFEADLTSDTINNFRDIVAFRGASKELRFETRTDNSVRVQSNMTTSGDNFNSATIGDTDNKKFAMTFTTSQVRLYADGSLVGTYNGAYSSDLVHILFMNSTSLGVETKTNFKQYLLFTSDLSNDECITLTTI